MGVAKWAGWLKSARLGGATDNDLSELCAKIQGETGLIPPPFKLFARWTDDKTGDDAAKREAAARQKAARDERTKANTIAVRLRKYESLKPRYEGEITEEMGTDRWLMSTKFTRFCEIVQAPERKAAERFIGKVMGEDVEGAK